MGYAKFEQPVCNLTSSLFRSSGSVYNHDCVRSMTNLSRTVEPALFYSNATARALSFVPQVIASGIISTFTFCTFQVVGHGYDCTELEDTNAIGVAYETIYALLQHISPSYQLSFHDAVASKLEAESNAEQNA